MKNLINLLRNGVDIETKLIGTSNNKTYKSIRENKSWDRYFWKLEKKRTYYCIIPHYMGKNLANYPSWKLASRNRYQWESKGIVLNITRCRHDIDEISLIELVMTKLKYDKRSA